MQSPLLSIALTAALLGLSAPDAMAQPSDKLTMNRLHLDETRYPEMTVAFDLKDHKGRPVVFTDTQTITLTESVPGQPAWLPVTATVQLTYTSDISIVLIVDDVLPKAQQQSYTQTLTAFASRLRPTDRLFVVTAHQSRSEPLKSTGSITTAAAYLRTMPFDKNHERSVSAVGSALDDAFEIVKANGLAANSHSAIVLASDFGGFNEPPQPPEQITNLIKRLKAADTRLHTILFSIDSIEGRKFPKLASAHRDLVQQAAGTITEASTVAAINTTLDRVVRDLRAEYAASFKSQAMPGEHVTVLGELRGSAGSDTRRTPCIEVTPVLTLTLWNGYTNVVNDEVQYEVDPRTKCAVKSVALELDSGAGFKPVSTTSDGLKGAWLLEPQFLTSIITPTRKPLRARVTDEGASSVSAVQLVIFPPAFVASLSPSPVVTTINSATFELFHSVPVVITPSIAGVSYTIVQKDNNHKLITIQRPDGYFLGFVPVSALPRRVDFSVRAEDEYQRHTDWMPARADFEAVDAFFDWVSRMSWVLAGLLSALAVLLILSWVRGLVVTRDVHIANSGNAGARFALRARSLDGFRVKLSGPAVTLRRSLGGHDWAQTSEIAAEGEGVVTLRLQRFLNGVSPRTTEVELHSAVLSLAAPALERGITHRAKTPLGEPDLWQRRAPVLIELPDKRWFWWRHLLAVALLLLAVAGCVYLAMASSDLLAALRL